MIQVNRRTRKEEEIQELPTLENREIVLKCLPVQERPLYCRRNGSFLFTIGLSYFQNAEKHRHFKIIHKTY